MCGKTDEKVHHTWGEFTCIAADQCRQERRCQRCGTTDARTMHDWDLWRYANWEYNAPQFRECRRCHEKEKTRATMH
ncbi:hypothetical protein [Actinoplanes sp. OR16]|uniref:hypothetical protein n=1 Tax=Actinoplanes sp. OR16 TaxID=946334 RepID=UPI000FDB34F3|nr:hypothetical protein [Actinoplanes sp. OR16]